MNNYFKVFFLSLALELGTMLLLTVFPAYLLPGQIVLWTLVIVIPPSLYFYIAKILHAKKALITVILGLSIFIPITILFALLFIGMGKGASLGQPDIIATWYDFIVLLFLLISIFTSTPFGLVFMYWIFNKPSTIKSDSLE